jgi:hypothetical protein
MPRKRGNLFCPKCKCIGGFLTKRWVKKANRIPRFEEVTTIVQAWDYATTVCLRMHTAHLRFPPNKELDKSISNALYNAFRKVCPHTLEEIEAFEARQLKRLLSEERNKRSNIRKKLKSKNRDAENNKLSSAEDQQYYWQDYDPYKEKIRIHLPPNTGTLTSSSIAWLYGAVIFKMLSSIYELFTFSEKENRLYSYVIYTVFNSYSAFYDDRQHVSLMDWIKIYEDAKNHGLAAASSLNPSFSLKGEKVQLSPKHIRNKLDKLEDQMLDIIFCTPYYTQLIDRISFIIKVNQPIGQVFLTTFEKFETQLNDGKFSNVYEYYFIKHTKTTAPRVMWCAISRVDLAYVTVVDDQYKLYEDFIYKIANVFSNGDSPLSSWDENLERYISCASHILQELGFRSDIVRDKIESNLIAEGLDSSISTSTVKNYIEKCDTFR